MLLVCCSSNRCSKPNGFPSSKASHGDVVFLSGRRRDWVDRGRMSQHLVLWNYHTQRESRVHIIAHTSKHTALKETYYAGQLYMQEEQGFIAFKGEWDGGPLAIAKIHDDTLNLLHICIMWGLECGSIVGVLRTQWKKFSLNLCNPSTLPHSV